MDKANIKFEEGWEQIEIGVTKLIRILEGKQEPTLDSRDYMALYTTIYNMCTPTPHDFSQELYDRYRKVYENYAKKTVLPSLDERHDDVLLRAFRYRWSNHKIMVRWLSRVFYYLDRYFITRRSLSSLEDVGYDCFRDIVYGGIKSKVKNAILASIHDEREGGRIDRMFLKNLLGIFIDMGMGEMKNYEEDFESFLLEETTNYYSCKAASWIQEDTCPEYMIKAEDCLRKEKKRVSHYLHSSTETKLIEKVENELLVVVAKQLQENENSGCRVLLKDDKIGDLSRMFKLYEKIAQGLEPIADLFKKHVTGEGQFLIKQVEDEAANQAARTGAVEEQVLIRKVIELHHKYMLYVTSCFQSHSLFHKALKEAFEIFLNKKVAGSSSAELLATFCDNLFRNKGTEKLSEAEIDATLENVVKLLVYISDKDLFDEFYRKKQEARRLLFNNNGSEDNEKLILAKLKEQFGGQFTSKIHFL